ncbi:MAG: MBG domain-containing protein [Cyclobacteriaceae bacterium]
MKSYFSAKAINLNLPAVHSANLTSAILLFCLMVSLTAIAQPPIPSGNCGRNILEFESGAYANIGSTITNFSYTSGTIEAWVRKTDWSDPLDDALFSNGIGFSSPNSFYVSFHHVVGLHFRYGGSEPGNAAAYVSTTSTDTLANNSWHHIAVTWNNDGSNTHLITYIDGIQIATASTSTNLVLSGGTSFGIGEGIVNSTNDFDGGSIAEFSLWDVARTQGQIQADMGQVLDGSETNLIGYWPLNDTQGNTTAANVVQPTEVATLRDFTDIPNAWINFPLEVKAENDIVQSGSTMDFGTVFLGANSATTTFTITNQGSTSLDLLGSSITELTGTNADQFTLNLTGTASTLAAGASRTFTLAFNPQTVGVKEAALAFTTVADCADPYTINLTGTGANFPSLQYSGDGFEESISNDGSVTGSIIISLTDDTFQDDDMDNLLDAGTEVTLGNIPSGLTPVLTLNSTTEAVLTLSGNATSHQNLNDVADISFEFSDAAFTNASAASVASATGPASSGLGIDFEDQPLITYFSHSGFTEVDNNNGSVYGEVSVILEGDNFKDDDDDNMLAFGTEFTMPNLPDGLVPNFSINISEEAFEAWSVGYSTSSWSAITYGDGRFLAVSSQGYFNISENGENWSWGIMPDLNSYSDVVYGNGLFVAISNNGSSQIKTSSDGSNWTSHTAPEANYWTSITYGNGLFVAVSSSGTNKVMTSPDGINWTSRFVPGDDLYASITYGNGLFVAVAALGSSGRVATSPDGITWTNRTAASTNIQWWEVTYGGGQFVAVSNSLLLNSVMTSPDGINWTIQTAAEANNWVGITYYDGQYYAASYSGTNSIMKSTDAINWTAVSTGGKNGWSDIIGAEEKIIAVGLESGNSISYTRTEPYSKALLTIDGNATSSNTDSDVADLTISFAGAAFVGTAAANIQNATGPASTGAGISFINTNGELSYSGSGFVESTANDGTLTGSIILTLTGDTFEDNDENGLLDYRQQYEFETPLPDGLTPVLTLTSASVGVLTLEGQVSDHQDVDDISELNFYFYNGRSAFTNSTKYEIINANNSQTGLGIDFNENATLSYSGSGFIETEGNDGTLTGTMVIDLTTDTFSDPDEDGLLQEASQYVISGLPAGLTPVMTIVSPTQLNLTLEGSVAIHLPKNSVSNLQLEFTNEAFTNELAAAVFNATGPYNTGIGITFKSNLLIYAGNGFAESEANDGSVIGSIQVILTGDNFQDDDSDAILDIESEVALNNISSGLTPDLAITKNTAAGDEWITLVADNDLQYRLMAYGNDTYVGLGYYGTNRLITSSDGVNWIPSAALDAMQWNDVVYGNGLFVALPSGENPIHTSTDGVTWTAGSALSEYGWYKLGYGNGVFVAVKGYGDFRVATSTDGINWTERVGHPAVGDFITFGNGKFVAGQYGENVLVTSTDGITWTQQTFSDLSYSYYGLNDIVYADGLFVAVSDYSEDENGDEISQLVLTSPDAITWTLRDTPNGYWYSVTYGDGVYAAVSYGGENSLMTSTDGISWTANANLPSETWNAIEFINGQFYAVAEDDDVQIMTSFKSAEASLTLTGNADDHNAINNVSDITFEFADAAFANSLAANVPNATGPASSGLGIDFSDNPENDDCNNPQMLTLHAPGEGIATEGSTLSAAINNGLNPCTESSDVRDVWYSFNSGTSGQVVITTELVTASAISGAIYTSCGAILEITDPFGGASVPACANNVSGPILVPLAPNTDFLLQIWMAAEDAGSFSVTLEENLPPSIESIADKTIDEETELQFTVTATDEFLPFGGIEFSLDEEFTNLGMNLTSVDAMSAQFSWTPTEDQDGEYSVTLTASDGNLQDSETFTLTVHEVNRPPVIATIEDVFLEAGEVISGLSFSATDPDNKNQELTFSLDQTSLDAGLSVSSGGDLSWTHKTTDYGTTRTVTVTVTDGFLTDTESFDISVDKAAQEILLNSLSYVEVFGNDPFEVSDMGGDSGNPLVYTFSNEGVVTIEAGLATIIGAGTTTVYVDQASNDNYYAADQQQFEITIEKASQTIEFTLGSTSFTYGDAPFNLTATGGDSGNPVIFESSNASVIAIEDNVATIVGLGEATITASQVGNANYNAAMVVEQSLTIVPRPITVAASVQSKTYGDADPELTYRILGETLLFEGESFSGSLQREAGEDVGTYTIQQGSLTLGDNYDISFESKDLTIIARAITVTADAKSKSYGDDDPELTYEITEGALAFEDVFIGNLSREEGEAVGQYAISLGALQVNDNYTLYYVPADFTISKTSQFIELASIDDQLTTFPPLAVEGSASSGLPLTIEVTGVANYENGLIVLTSQVGTVTVTASQAGNENYLAADPVAITFEVIESGSTPQSINFTQIGDKVYGDDAFDLTATATSDLPVYFTVDGPAAVSGTLVSITGAGEVTVTAVQAGSIEYAPASTTQTFTVAKRDQLITLPEIADKSIIDGSFSIGATVDSELDLIYEVIGPATISPFGEISLSGMTGQVRVTVSQIGDDNHNAALPVTASFLVSDPSKTNQTITFPIISTKVFGQGSFDLAATSDADLTVTYELVSGPITLSGNTVTITGAGTASIRASQNGNGDFNPAPPVTQSFVINKASQVVTFTAIPDKIYGDQPFILSANASTGLPTTFQVLLGPARVNGNSLTITGSGEVIVQADQAGNGNYAAGLATRTFTVAKAPLKVIADALTRSYGATNPEFTVSYEGFVNGDDEGDITPPVASTQADETSPVTAEGYPISLSGGSSDYYELTLVSGVLTIEKTELVATAEDKQRAFGLANPELTIAYSGFVNGDTESDITAPVATTTATATSPDGTYTIELAGGSAQNYALTLKPGTLTVGKAQLIVRADDLTKSYGSANPPLILSYEGFVNGDTPEDITPPLASTVVESGTVPGVYAITLTGGSADNYELVLEAGELTVNKAPLTVTAEKVIDYGQPIGGFEIVYRGFVNGQDATILETLPTASTTAVDGSNAGSYPIALAGGTSELYDFIYDEGTLTIRKLLATITISELEQEISDEGNQLVVTTDPTDLAYIVTYDGSTQPPTEPGEYEVTVTIDDLNYEGAVAGTLIINGAVTAIEELPVVVSLYPNPVQDILSVEVTNSSLNEVEVYSLNGVLMMGRPLVGNKAEIDVQAWPTGMYLIRLMGDNNETLMQRKFIKE